MSRGRTTARRLLHSILSSEWAILPEWLEQFAGIATRLNGSESLTAEDVRREIREALATLNEERAHPQAVAFEAGASLGDGTRATHRDGVAIIPAIGPLYHYADEMHDVCGCSSYAQIARDVSAVRAARERGVVRSAILETDSPGGEVAGASETGSLIAQLAAEMPMAAFVSDLGASAGYWLAISAGRVVVAPTAIVGSIGVVAAVRRRGDENLIGIVSSQSPKKRPDVETDSGKAQIQATVDALAEVFVGAVAGYRKRTVAEVLEGFGQGDVFVGERAKIAGLVDEIGTMEGLITQLAERGKSAARLRPAATTKPGGRRMDPIEQAREEGRLAGVAEGRAAAATETQAAVATAVTAERERITAVLSLGFDESGLRPSARGHGGVILAAVAAPGTTKAEAALQLIEAREAKDTAAAGAKLAAIQGDEKKLNQPGPGAHSGLEEGAPSTLNRLRAAGDLRKSKSRNGAPSKN